MHRNYIEQELYRLQQAQDLLALRLRSRDYADEEDRLYLIDKIKVVAREYRKLRGSIDVLYFAYEYFSDERNPENENNLMPAGATMANAPAFHYELCSTLDSLLEDITKKIGWSVPRGHAKSAYLSNVYPVHQIVYELRHYILIISETESMSQKFIEWVGDQLKFNKKLREDFGDLLSPNKMKNTEDNQGGFVTANRIKVQSASIGKQLRGARHGAYRPDLVILDDLESSKNTNTRELREKNLHWFNSVVMPIGDITRTAYIYMGTLVHGQGLLPAVLKRSDFHSKIYSAIVSEPDRLDLWSKYEEILRDVDNPDRAEEADAFYYDNREEMDKGARTLWNSRFPYKDLINIKINVGSKAFASEYLNRPSDDESCIFKKQYFTFYNELDLRVENGRYYNSDNTALEVYSFWDIAIGKNRRSDYNAIVTIGVNRRTGVIYILDSWADKIPMHEALKVAQQKITTFRPKLFGVEAVQAQYDMYRQLNEKTIKAGFYGTRVMPINPRGKKEDRIEQLEPLVEQGYIRFHKSQRLLLEMLELFGSHDHDDLPDALASVVELSGKQRRKTYYRKPAGV